MRHEERFERIERHVEFLAQNQAELTANMGTLRQELLELARIVQQHVFTTETRFQAVVERFEGVAKQFQGVAERFEGVVGHVHEVDEAIKSLTHAQRITEERLNALVIVVERYFSNGRH